ncbi:MAG: sigma-54-dependent transcriptional regulator [Kofleriaceae bacterium]
MHAGRVLFVDDDPKFCDVVKRALHHHGFSVLTATTGEGALALLRTEEVDTVITDLRMPEMDGLQLLERIAQQRSGVPVIVVTAFGSMDTAVAALRAGAYDFVTKPFTLDVLALAAARAVKHRRLTDEVMKLRARVATGRGGALVGESAAMREVVALIDRVAETDASVLITGESGTGKELVAREIHARSKRHDGKLVAINCAAMPPSLLESELFGHVKGAFTDAKASHAGLFAAANGGTLFLDEIGELPLSLQPKLLRVLQERVVRPVGGDREIPIDVRLITATNRDLETAIEDRTFREDLYYRIHVVHVPLPPLRARGADIMLLAQSFLVDAAARFDKGVRGFSPAAAEKLSAYSWPGNVRELANAIESAVALARFAELGVEDLPPKIQTFTPAKIEIAGSDPTDLEPLDEIERRYIVHVLDACGGNQSLAAQVLQIDRKTLHRRLKSYAMRNLAPAAEG